MSSLLVDPNDAIPEEHGEKTINKRKPDSETTETENQDQEKKKKKKKSDPKPERRQSETVEVDGTIETHTTLSPRTPPGDPPESDELIKVSQDLVLFFRHSNIICIKKTTCGEYERWFISVADSIAGFYLLVAAQCST